MDVVKLHIIWDGSLYLDFAIVFGLIYRTSAFQVVADTIAHIMSSKGG